MLEETAMAQPRLLLIDDEPALADFVANAARECGFVPRVARTEEEFRQDFIDTMPDMVTLDLGMPGMDGVEFLRFLSAQHFGGPVLIISGFDRRVLESAFRLGEALGLRMAGPLEKPTRLEDLESVFNSLKPTLAT
jgi:CheY-like chemotaxis protein